MISYVIIPAFNNQVPQINANHLNDLKIDFKQSKPVLVFPFFKRT